jgi:hypothetical protein
VLLHLASAALGDEGIDLGLRRNLVRHFGEPVGIGFHRLREELQRHLLAELQVIGQIDLAHAAAAELSHDAVPAAHHVAGHEAAEVG